MKQFLILLYTVGFIFYSFTAVYTTFKEASFLLGGICALSLTFLILDTNGKSNAEL
jgi:hypothetical protein